MSKIKLLAGKRLDNESPKHIKACNDYLRMGVARSLRKLIVKWGEDGEETGQKPPTTSQNTIESWSKKYDWVVRSEEFDAVDDEERTLQRKAIMQDGIALDYERVKELKEMYYETSINLAASTGVEAHYKYLNVLRGVLNDIAKETGGRVTQQKVDHTSKGEALEFNVTISDD